MNTTVNRLLLSLIACLVLAGCDQLRIPPSEDVSRLESIDRKFEQEDFDHVISETTKYVQEYPRSFKGWNLLGWAYVKSGELDKAEECFDKTLSINPRWDNAHVGKGAIYREKGDLKNARKSYLQAIRIVPENAEAFGSLLVIELLEENDEKAVEYGEKAWALRKDLATIPANLAVAYHYLGDHAKRDQYYEEAEKLGYNGLQTLKDIFEGKMTIR